MAFIKRSVVNVDLMKEEIPSWLDAKALVSAVKDDEEKAEEADLSEATKEGKKED